MQYFWMTIDAGVLGLAFWIVATFAYYLATEQGSLWQRVLAAGKDSATMVWAKLCIATGAGIGGLVSLSDALGDPQIGAAIQKWLTPQIASGVLVAAMVITALARKRTL